MPVVYMKADDFIGEARGDDREDSVVGIGLEWELNRRMDRTAQGEAVGGNVTTGLIKMTKYPCLATPSIIKAISLNINVPSVEFDIAVEDNEEEINQIKIEASECKFMDYRVVNDGMDPDRTQMVEEFSVFFESAVFTYTALSRSPKSGEDLGFEHFVDPNSRES